MHPHKAVALGIGLMLLGILIPLLNILRILEASFMLSFLAYAASSAGLILGIMGAAALARRHHE